MEFLYLLAGILTGLVIGWLTARLANRTALEQMQNKLNLAEQDKILKISDIDKERSILLDRIGRLESEFEAVQASLAAEQEKSALLGNRLVKEETEKKALLEKLSTQKAELEDLQTKFRQEFENLAHRILKQNTIDFSEANIKNISDILNPLKEKISTFEKKVQDTYETELRESVSLKQEVKTLYELNKQLSEEAGNLAKALKGDVKKAGNWGEIVLERVLELSGLTKGENYDTQVTYRDEQGDLFKPDVVVYLPDKKHIIIDSKVSLVAYEAMVNAETQEDQDRYMRAHLDSIRTHVRQLSEKQYQGSDKFDTPDFVLLFMPMESAFGLAVKADPELFRFAWDRKIVIVSPTTLLATLRTVEAIWKHEKQNQNALEIARLGGAMYDKLRVFCETFEKLGNQIDTVKKSFDEAQGQLATGSGNLVRRAEAMRKLGAKTGSRTIPDRFLNMDDNQITENEE